MEIKKIETGAYGTCCYLIYLPDNSKLYLVDPGNDAPEIVQLARTFPFKSAEILLTHAHIDHISGVAEVAQSLAITKIRLAKEDHAIYFSPQNAIPPYYPSLPKSELLPVCDYEANPDYEVLPLPGHTPGGRGLLFRQSTPPVLCCGDTIFRESIGRTDLPGGKFSDLMNSIKTQILALPDQVILYPGHGPESTVGFERRHNPYLDENYYEV